MPTTVPAIKNNAIPVPLTDPAKAVSGESFTYYVVFIWRALIFVGGLLVIFFFIQGAFEWINANGEASKITTARNKMTGAMTGFIILIGLFAIIALIEGIFGLNILSPTLPTP